MQQEGQKGYKEERAEGGFHGGPVGKNLPSWAEEPAALQFMKLQRVRHNLATKPPVQFRGHMFDPWSGDQ